MPLSPIRRQTITGLSKGVQSSAIDVTRDGYSVRYVEVRPLSPPDAGSTHEVQFNDSSGDKYPMDEGGSGVYYAFKIDPVAANRAHEYLVDTIWLTPGSGAEFEVISIL